MCRNLEDLALVKFLSDILYNPLSMASFKPKTEYVLILKKLGLNREFDQYRSTCVGTAMRYI